MEMNINYCGFNLINPFLLASAPPTTTGPMMARAYEAGWAGGVTKTLVRDASVVENVTPRLASLSYPTEPGQTRNIFALMNIELVTDRSLDKWLGEITDLAEKYPDRMTIASIMADASRPDGWQEMAERCEKAGAHAIEINMSCPHGMPERGMGMAIGQDPDIANQVTAWTKEATKLPVIAKMTPNVTDICYPARVCVEAGADSLSAINTVASIMGVDLENLVPLPNVWGSSTQGGMSGAAVKPIALRAVAALAQEFDVPISGIGGISTWRDAAEFLLLGSNNVQVCTSVMFKGYGIIDDLLKGLHDYMHHKGFDSVHDMQGQALKNLVNHSDLDAQRKMVAFIDPNRASEPSLEECRVACLDAGYQAILKRKDGTYEVNTKRCTGCSLCYHVCAVDGCISMVAKA